MLQRLTNKQLCHEENKAFNSCNLKNSKVNDLPELEKYLKYKYKMLDEDYVKSSIAL